MDYLREVKRTCSRLGLGYAAFFLAGLLLQILAVWLLGMLADMGIEFDWYNGVMLFGSLSLYVVGTLVYWLIVKDMDTTWRPQKKKFTAGQLVAAFFICISVLYIGNMIGNCLMLIVSWIQGKPMINPAAELVTNLNPWTLFLLTVVAAPVVEELLFRKLLIDRIAWFGDRTAIILSGVLFGISHRNFYQFFYAFGLGIIFAYIYINTGQLRYTIAFHAIINFFGSIVALIVIKNLWFLAAYGVFAITGIVLGIVFLVMFRREIRFMPAFFEIPKGRWFKALFLNFGMILFFCVTAGMIAIS